jgi:hypothetical protein
VDGAGQWVGGSDPATPPPAFPGDWDGSSQRGDRAAWERGCCFGKAVPGPAELLRWTQAHRQMAWPAAHGRPRVPPLPPLNWRAPPPPFPRPCMQAGRRGQHHCVPPVRQAHRQRPHRGAVLGWGLGRRGPAARPHLMRRGGTGPARAALGHPIAGLGLAAGPLRGPLNPPPQPPALAGRGRRPAPASHKPHSSVSPAGARAAWWGAGLRRGARLAAP